MTTIEWTERTWNPIVGCSRVSKGCEHCYAERVAHRGMSAQHRGLTVMGKHGPRWTGEVRFLPERLTEPLKWKKAARIFVNSMSDLFHENVSAFDVARVFAVMAEASRHTFQVLTKRPARMRALLSSEMFWSDVDAAWCRLFSGDRTDEEHDGVANMLMERRLPNVWPGVSVEDQQSADERIPLLLECPAALRWVSYEPAIGPVDFRRYMWPVHPRWPAPYRTPEEARAAGAKVTMHRQALVLQGSRFLDWIVVGGESGPGARPFDVAWARSTIDQCRDAGVRGFVKQLGAHVLTRNDDNFTIEEEPMDPDFPGWPLHLEHENRVETTERYQGAPARVRLRDRKGGDMSEWRTDLHVREYPKGANGT